MQTAIDQITSFLKLGGPVVSILLVLSVFALAIILIKIVQFSFERVGFHKTAHHAEALWRSGHHLQALDVSKNKKGLVDQANTLTMECLIQRRACKQEIEEAVSVMASQRLHEMQRGFRAMDSIAQIAPLLGLFGTVLGMITAFQKLQEAGNSVDPSILAGGIWVALLTTAVGLAVAMPVSLALTWFETRLDNERVAVESAVGNLLNTSLQQQSVPTSEPNAGGLAHAD